MKNTLVWQGGKPYTNYRIPGLTVSARGTLLLVCEARRSAGDWANMDILLYRSADGGDTFSDPIVLAAGTEEYPTVDNPVCIAEPDGTLHVLYCRMYSVGGGGVFIRSSDDDGLTWSEPRDIMNATLPEFHNAFALGPGHGICLSDGTLLIPVWMVPKSAGSPLHAHGPSVVSTLYSTDHGKIWQTGEIIPATEAAPSPNESVAAELPDGRVYLNVRAVKTGFRARTWSRTGFSGWDPLVLDPALVDPTCFGSVVRYAHGGVDALLTVHCAHPTERRNLVCRASFDGGLTWPRALTVEPDGAGYADIAVLPDGTVCVLYEQRAGECDRLARFRLEELL